MELGEISHLQTEEKPALDKEGWQYFVSASPKALETDNQRYSGIKPLLDGETYCSLETDISERTLRHCSVLEAKI